MLFSLLIERLSYSTPDSSMTDFHNALKQGKTIEPAGIISENGRFLLKEPSNIDELYEKLFSALSRQSHLRIYGADSTGAEKTGIHGRTAKTH